jgi:hypothetical protein
MSKSSSTSLALNILNSRTQFINGWENAVSRVQELEQLYEDPDIIGKRKIIRPIVQFWNQQHALLASIIAYYDSLKSGDTTAQDAWLAKVNVMVAKFRSLKSVIETSSGSEHKLVPVHGQITSGRFIPPFVFVDKVLNPTIDRVELRYSTTTTIGVWAMEREKTSLGAGNGGKAGVLDSDKLADVGVSDAFEDLMDYMFDLIEMVNSPEDFDSTALITPNTTLDIIDAFVADIYPRAIWSRETVNAYAELTYKYVSDEILEVSEQKHDELLV